MTACAAKKTVLVVDDQYELRELIVALLSDEGYDFLLAADGIEALERLSGLAQDRDCVVVSDLQMPRMSGRQLLRSIRNDARLEKLPVVIVSSAVRDHDLRDADGVLEKPFCPTELRSMVAHLFAA